ncbi:MAG: carboxymuconolactone decarboxylase family protein [Pseudomonadota bacterium]|jgi:4-carboxymuconolactone decarboxylase|nr:carboxymuconolactone decarboxylase family protein [Pseudomonadota bacterium]
MSDDVLAMSILQGFAEDRFDRLPLPTLGSLDPQQKAAAEALILGPRKGVFGPFVPLLRAPELLDCVAKLGEYLRFRSDLDARIRELAICAVARHVSNQFEWLTHAALALTAGVSDRTLEAVRVGERPRNLPEDEELALDFVRELLTTHGVSEPTYQRLLAASGERGVVELTALVGYFVTVSWLMNVARTPTQAPSSGRPLGAFPQ